MSKIKLFCLPYAGGSAAIFNKWKQFVNPAIELVPIELAGRGKRIKEALYKDVNEVVEDVFQVIKEKIDHSHYALLGHSMGAMISYELAQRIADSDLPSPLHVFFSGRKAPHVKRADEKFFHLMNDDEFKLEVIRLGGTPPEFFEHPELLELFLPFLKNDFKIAEAEMHFTEIRPLDCNITVFLGKDEDLTAEECHGWKLHTKQLCSIYYFEGGHFFLHSETEGLVKIINSTLLEIPLRKINSLKIA
jgi:surfactin synthase thioesterase subunit